MIKLAILFVLLTSFSGAQTWRGNTTGYGYITFNGEGPNIFDGAVGADGKTWTDTGDDWLSGINNPWWWANAIDAGFIDNQLYVVNACSADTGTSPTGYNCIPWKVGIVNPTNGKVFTLVTNDWTNVISGISACDEPHFVHNFDESIYQADGYVHLMVPCDISGTWTLYETHSLPTDMESWSAPVNTGFLGGYDANFYFDGTTFWIWWTTADANNYLQLASSTALLGPYASVETGDWAGWGNHKEGGYVYPAPSGSGYVWYLQMESSVTPRITYYSACSTTSFTACTWTVKASYISQFHYRHGAILSLHTPSATLPHTNRPLMFPGTGDYVPLTNLASIHCPTPNAIAHFTRDGSTPTSASPVYTAPYTVSSTETDKAICVESGFQNSDVSTAVYTIHAAQNMTTFTKADPGSYMTISTSGVLVKNMPTNLSNEYLYKDFGASFFTGDLKEDFSVYYANFESGSTQAASYLWGLSDSIGDLDTTGNNMAVQVNAQTDGTLATYIGERFSGTKNQAQTGKNLQPFTPYYFTVIRSGMVLTVNVYTDMQRTNLYTTASYTATSAVAYRYMYGASAVNGALTAAQTTFTKDFFIIL